jgi:hypothetical protein
VTALSLKNTLDAGVSNHATSFNRWIWPLKRSKIIITQDVIRKRNPKIVTKLYTTCFWLVFLSCIKIADRRFKTDDILWSVLI